MLRDITGHAVNSKLAMEIEADPRKREWLAKTSHPELLFDDVTAFGSNNEAVNHIDGEYAPLPFKLDCYSCGFSCKDLSSLNNVSREWSADCLASGQGSTGATWKGNLDVVDATKPLWVQMENVPAALHLRHRRTMEADLRARGYCLFFIKLNAVRYGLPQSRQRAWFSAIREDVVVERAKWNFAELVAQLELCEPLPLRDFLLPPGDKYLEQVMAERQQAAEARAARAARAKESANAQKKTGRKIVKRCGKKWLADHWKVRRALNMATSLELPTPIKTAARKNGMCERESDLLDIIVNGPAKPNAEEQPTVELKHSAPRVVGRQGVKKRHFSGATSCLLPTSRMMVMPPIVPEMRYLLGREALAIQGLDCGGGHGLTDSELQHIAGNAFSGSCFAAMFLATLVHLNTYKF